VVLPHQPAALQQLPNVLPKQVNLVVPPQVASVETALVPVEVAAEEVAVDALVELEAVVAAAPPAVRYQFAAGSPRHSPTVTPLYPRVVRVESM